MAPSNRIGIGFIGLGRQAVHANMSVFLRSGYCQTVALCDVDRWRLAIEGNPSAAAVAKKNQWDLALLKDTFRTTDFRELLAHEGVDAVMISTPDHWHVPIALAAIKAGKDVALEKPIGLAIAHGRVLADAAAKAKTVFRTDSNFRGTLISLSTLEKEPAMSVLRYIFPCLFVIVAVLSAAHAQCRDAARRRGQL